MPHSGPASVNGVIGRAYEAYFRMVNEQGGINGRKVTFFTEDDAFSPPKTVEATRRLVEQEGVLGLAGSLGTGPQLAVQKYLNGKSIPQIMMNTGASRWNNPQEFPWTTPGLPPYTTEARVDAKYVCFACGRTPKVAIPYQNDDFGRDFMKAFRTAWPKAAAKAMVVAEMPYELTDPSPGRADHQARAIRRRHVSEHLARQGDRASDQEDRRSRLEAATPSRQRLGIPACPPGGRPRRGKGHRHGGVSEGHEFPAMAKRSRREGNSGNSGSNTCRTWRPTIPTPSPHGLRPSSFARSWSDARRTHAREPSEAGARHQGPGCSRISPGRDLYDDEHGLFPGPHALYAEIQRKRLGAAGFPGDGLMPAARAGEAFRRAFRQRHRADTRENLLYGARHVAKPGYPSGRPVACGDMRKGTWRTRENDIPGQDA